MPDFTRPELLTDEQGDIADLLELAERKPAWHADAACLEAPPEVSWFPETGGDGGKAAKEYCARCLVREECLAWSLEQGPDLDGIFGGINQRGRQMLRRQAKRWAA